MNVPQVTIEQGLLRGSIGNDFNGKTYYKFQGIPYAKPPLGSLRFKAPVAPEKWNGIFDATKEGSPCYARDMLRRDLIIGSEDCLVLNVYTKQLLDDKKNTNLLPVMVWIHGGAFTKGSGSSELYGPDFLITEDVVIVTINYRLGMLGFISFEDTSLGIPGNAGLKDMVMALRWVQKNISNFGGDPKNVTIFGESAGGAAVHFLVLSPLSRGLFHKAIAQSGSALNPWTRGKPIKEIASALGLETTDEKAIYKVLITKSVEELYQLQEKIQDLALPCDRRPFGVVVEKQSNEQIFLPYEPINIMLSGKFNQVPFMTGYTTAEGMVYELIKDPGDPIDRPTFEDVIPWFFGYQIGSQESKTIADKIKRFYYDNEEPCASNVGKKYKMLSDPTFLYGIYVTLISQCCASKTPTYFYRMSIETTLNIFKQILKIQEPGVSHADDLGYLFKHAATPEIKPGSIEELAVKRFVKLWTNFAKFGNPTPHSNDPLLNVIWKPVTGQELDFLDIGTDLRTSSKPDLERINFWKTLFANSPAGQKVSCVKM